LRVGDIKVIQVVLTSTHWEVRMIFGQYKVLRYSGLGIAFLVLATPALFGRSQVAAPIPAASPASCSDTGVTFADSAVSRPEQVRSMLLAGEETALTPVILSAPPPKTNIEKVSSPANPEKTVHAAGYLWDSNLWGRLDCLRQQRMRQKLFGIRAQRCSLG
jgi:hypothetical protein